jgi:hypothetical protein
MFTSIHFGDFLIGTLNSAFYGVVKQDNHCIAICSFFVQNERRVSAKLTLSNGLRLLPYPATSALSVALPMEEAIWGARHRFGRGIPAFGRPEMRA